MHLFRKWVTYAGAIHMCLFGLMGAFSINWHMLALAMFGMVKENKIFSQHITEKF